MDRLMLRHLLQLLRNPKRKPRPHPLGLFRFKVRETVQRVAKMSRIDPHRFTGLQLVPTAIADDDYAIAIDGLGAGRIMRQARAFGKETWFWTITGPALVQAGLPSSGEAETLEDARKAFRLTFDKWLRWAMAESGPVIWHAGPS